MSGEMEDVELVGVVGENGLTASAPPEDPNQEEVPGSREEEKKQQPGEPKIRLQDIGEEDREESFISFRMLQILLVVCQTFILIIGAVYINWWPSNINIYASDRNNDESLGDTADEDRILQIWQSIYLTLSLLCTFYGVGMQDRGWLMLSMFMNIGIMSLLPFRNGNTEMAFLFFVFIFGVISVSLCFILSERIQNRFLLDDNVNPEDKKMHILCFDFPDLSLYHMGIVQVLTSSVMVFMGLLWMLLQEAMITSTARANFSCNGWPDGQCSRYYGFKAQEYYVGRITISLCVAGAFGIFGGILKCRTVLTLALVLTIIPFSGIIENGIYTFGNSEDVSYMCGDEDWWLQDDRLTTFWGDDWDCTTQENYHKYSVVFMIIISTVSLCHLWICLRFSEKIQSKDEERIERNPNCFGRFWQWLNAPKRMRLLLLVLSFFVAIGGFVQIGYGAEAASSTQTEVNYDGEDVVVLDSPSYIDAHYIYACLSIFSAVLIWIFFFLNDRNILCFVFALLVETHAIGFQNLIWHEADLKYGIVEFATNSISIYPVYINGDARDLLNGSIQVYYVFNIFIMITIFVSLLTSEAMQDEDKDEIDNVLPV